MDGKAEMRAAGVRSSEGRRAAGRACSQVERAARSTLPLVGGRERGCEVCVG